MAQTARFIGEITAELAKVQSRERLASAKTRALAAHREPITALHAQIEHLRTRTVDLTAETVALTDTASAMSTVYHVIGTREEPAQRGIVVEEGGSRVLFVFDKRGKTPPPARDLPVSEFPPIDSRSVTEIPLPGPMGPVPHRVTAEPGVSRDATRREGLLRGITALRIGQPDKFWLPSKFLIIVKSDA